MFFSTIFVTTGLLQGLAAAANLKVGPAFPVPDFDLGSSPAVNVKVAAVDNLYCNLQPARLCNLQDSQKAATYLDTIDVNCAITAPMLAQTGIQLTRIGTASVVLTTRKPGTITMPCSAAAALLDEINMNCENKNGQRVKGLIQVPASNYTAEGFAPDAHTLSIYVQHA